MGLMLNLFIDWFSFVYMKNYLVLKILKEIHVGDIY